MLGAPAPQDAYKDDITDWLPLQPTPDPGL